MASMFEAPGKVISTHIACIRLNTFALALAGSFARFTSISRFQEAVFSDVLRSSEDPLAAAGDALRLGLGERRSCNRGI